mgnify:CR=1 FL=1
MEHLSLDDDFPAVDDVDTLTKVLAANAGERVDVLACGCCLCCPDGCCDAVDLADDGGGVESADLLECPLVSCVEGFPTVDTQLFGASRLEIIAGRL